MVFIGNRRSKFKNGVRTSVHVEEWKLELLKLLGIPLSMVVEKGFDAITGVYINGGKVHSVYLTHILDEERSRHDHIKARISTLEAVMGGNLLDLKDRVEVVQKMEIIAKTLGNPESWYRKLPELDLNCYYIEQWDEVARKATEEIGAVITAKELQKFVRMNHVEEEA